MSQQQGFGDGGTPGVPGIETLTGNSGGAVGGAGSPINITLVGDNATGINIVGSPGTSTMTVFGIQATTTQVGVSEFADGTETTTGTDGTRAVTPLGLASKLGSQTSNGLAYGNGTTGAIQWLAAATNGQIPIGSTGNAPVLGNITSLDGSVIITNGPGTIDLSIQGEVSGTASTSGSPDTQTIITLPLGATPGAYQIRVETIAWATLGGLGVTGAFETLTVYTDGATASLVGTVDVQTESTGLSSFSSYTSVSGNNIIVQAFGSAGYDVNWKSVLNFVKVT